jgi:hypothetical protein
MTLRSFYRPLQPDLDDFLFAAVGPEKDSIPLSVISALTRLGLDPREEATRLSSLNRREAVEQLARLIAELPGACRPLPEARAIAGELIGMLPKHGNNVSPSPVAGGYQLPITQKKSLFWLIWLAAAAAAIFSISRTLF